MFQGYPKCIEIILMATGSSYDDQALLSWISYPYIFKILIAPLLDFAFIQKLGKSKTYIIIPGLIVRMISICLNFLIAVRFLADYLVLC